MNKKDIDLLLKVTSIQSSTVEDTEIMAYIKDYVTETLKLTFEEDTYGNICVTKGTGENGYKTIVCHTDTVHSIYEYRQVFIHDNFVYAMGKTEKNGVLRQLGIGGDDRVGIYMCLKALEDFDNIKAVFFRFEETGRKGSRACNMDFFNNSNFVIQPDRKGYGDFIRRSCGVQMCSDEFIETMKPLYEKYDYKVVEGIATDVDVLKTRGLDVCSINIGCGYFSPHSSNEVIHIPSMESCYNLIKEMFEQHGNTKFEHTYTAPVYTNYSNRNTSRYGTYSDLFAVGGRNKKSFHFTNSAEDNFFKKRLLNDVFIEENKSTQGIILKLTKTSYKNFERIEGSNFYVLKRFEAIPVNNYNGIVYLPIENRFYNVNLNNYIDEVMLCNNMYHLMEVTDSGQDFVYSDMNEVWLKKEDAVWDKTYQAWDFELK